VFGSAGMVTAGNGARTAMMLRDATGLHQETARGDVEMMGDAYTAEFVEFVDAIQQARQPYVTGQDARRALDIALACIESVQAHAPIAIDRSPATLVR
jgi:myo-inositol 2-dehydrogenase / D-chiro-inositol 1-dehydrogenase